MFRVLAVLLAVHCSSGVDGSPNAKKDRPPYDTPVGFFETQALELARELAPERLEAARVLLSNPDVNPLDDKQAAFIIDAAISTYCHAHNRHLPITAEMDDADRTSVKLAELSKIFTEYGYPNESKRAFELSSSSRQKSSTAKKVGQQNDTPVDLLKAQALAVLKEMALTRIEAAKDLLSNPRADPYNDKNLFRAVDAAFFSYHSAYTVPLPDLGNLSENERTALKVETLKRIFDTVDIASEIKKAARTVTARY